MKAPQSGTAVGQGVDRYDGKLKVTGGARYSGDMPVEGVTHAVLIQSTIAKGQIKSLDTAEAEKAPGVVKVITYLNAMPLASGQKLLNGPEIQFSGEHLGVVVAESLEQATYAAKLVKIEYEEAKPTTVLEDHLADSVSAQSRGPAKRGDAECGLASASKKIQEIYRTPIEHHNPMEPHAALAVWEGQKLTVYDATQGVSGSQQNLSRTFGLPVSDVRVVAYFIGGGFGCKGMPWPHTPIAALAAKMVGRPVRLVLQREQMFTSNGHRPQTRQEVTIGTDDAGKLVGFKHVSHTSTSQKSNFAEPTGSVTSMMYSCENLSVEQHLVRLNTGDPTYMRAPGESSGSFATEVGMDEMAVALGMDPIEFRIKNYAEKDESTGHPWSSKSLKECYAQAAARFGWSRRTPEPRSMRDGNVLIGLGMASATYPANYRAASAKAEIGPDGRVHVTCGTQDIGTGSYTILQQIAADALGVSLDVVRVDIGDSNLPQAPGSGGSVSAASAGSAVQAAAAGLKEKLLALATQSDGSPLHGLSESEFTVVNGEIHADSKRLKYGDVVKMSGAPTVSVETKSADRTNEYSMHSFGAQFAEVHVDADLGTIRVAKMVSAFAAGKILNAKTGLSQFRGGIIFGIGMALMEESVLDPTYGRFVNGTFAEYHVPVNADIPPIDVIMVHEDDPYVNPIGVKGIGEIGIVGTAAAICNAVYHATGKRVRDLPITLDKVL